MLVLLSPAKTLDLKTPSQGNETTQPRLMEHSLELLEILRGLECPQLIKLQDISEKLALLNYERWQSMNYPFPSGSAKEALLAFKGEVYQGLDAKSLSREDLDFAQDHVRMLSGFYGLLRPLDQMYPYRLEMGNALGNARGKDLYAFWGNLISKLINEDSQNEDAVVNLASQEYFGAVKPGQLQKPLIHIHFKENKNGVYKIIGVHAKKARGLMTRFMIDHRLKQAEELKSFDLANYTFRPELSTESEWTFAR